MQRDGNIFHGQFYTNKYPEAIASQRHGYRVRCAQCGIQTCWWHYEREATTSWNKRSNDQAVAPAERGSPPAQS